MTIYENVMLNWDGDGDYAQTVVPLSEVEEQNRERAHLVRENARLRRALEVLRDRRDWISAADVDAFIRNALSA